MVVYSDVVFLSSDARESNGKVYHNVTLESVEDGDIRRLGVDAGVLEGKKKYTRYKAKIKNGIAKNGMWERVVDMVEIPASAK